MSRCVMCDGGLYAYIGAAVCKSLDKHYLYAEDINGNANVV